MKFNRIETFSPPDQKYGTLKTKSLDEKAKLIIKKTTGEDTFSDDYVINFYDSWLSVHSGKYIYWYPIKSILTIKEENNFIHFPSSREERQIGGDDDTRI